MSTELTPGETAPFSHREIFFAAPYNVGRGLNTFGGFENSNLKEIDTISDICDAVNPSEVVIGDDKVWPELMLSEVARKEMANREGSMTSIGRRQDRMDDVDGDPIMWQDIYTTEMPAAKWVVGRANVDPEIYEIFSDVSSDSGAMTEVGKSAESRTFIWSTSEITWEHIRLTDMAIANVIAGEVDETYPDAVDSMDDLLSIPDIGTEIDSNTTATQMVRDGRVSSAKYAGYIAGISYDQYSSLHELLFRVADLNTIHSNDQSINTLWKRSTSGRANTNIEDNNSGIGGSRRIRLSANGSNNNSDNGNASASIDDVDVTNANSATLNWTYSIENQGNNNNSRYTRARFQVGDQTITKYPWNHANGTNTETIDLSGESGRQTIRVECYLNDTNNYNPSGNVRINQIYLG